MPTAPSRPGTVATPRSTFVQNGGKRSDPFAADKPLFSITSKNLAQYADKLSDGTKEMFKRFPTPIASDVYPTRRTAAAPQWVYDNTLKNATRAKLVDSSAGPVEGAFGGIPFPIPQNGAEAMWNHLLNWRRNLGVDAFPSLPDDRRWQAGHDHRRPGHPGDAVLLQGRHAR